MKNIIKLSFVFLVAAIISCQTKKEGKGFNPPKSVVDLSPVIGEDAPRKFVGAKFLSDFGLPVSTVFHHYRSEDPIYYEDSKLELFNHIGPHHDAPSHMIKGARTTDDFSLDQFMGPAKIFDFTAKPKDLPLTKNDFENKGIMPGDIVIAYVGYVPPGDTVSYPTYAFLSGEAADYLAGLPVKLFATDMPSLAGLKNLSSMMAKGELKGNDKLVPEHYAFASKNVPSIEGLVNLDKIVNEKNLVFIGFPLKIEKGNAGPIRAAALVY